MLKIILKRYYGDPNVTKSHVQVLGDGEVLMECEAREIGFADYEDGDKKVRTTYFCMQRGEFLLDFSSCHRNPLCLKLRGAHSHRGLKIYCNPEVETAANAILLGYADAEVAPERRKLRDVVQCRRDFITILYRYAGDEARIEVTNEGIEYNPEATGFELPTYL